MALSRRIIGRAAGGLLVACALLEILARTGLPLGVLDPGLGCDPNRVRALQAYVAGGMRGIFQGSAFHGYHYADHLPTVNRWGFHGDDWELGEHPDVLRIACVGASTTAPSAAGSYPADLERLLREDGREVEVMNFGVAGWTTAESLANYALLAQDFVPDLVLIHHAVNDIPPRRWPEFKPDYTHYRALMREPELPWISRRMIPLSFAYASVATHRIPRDVAATAVRVLPKGSTQEEFTAETLAPFVRNVRSIATLAAARGGRAVIVTLPCYPVGAAGRKADFFIRGIADHNDALRELARTEGLPLIDLAEAWQENTEETRPFFLDHVHLTQAGKARKASDIRAGLLAAELLAD